MTLRRLFISVLIAALLLTVPSCGTGKAAESASAKSSKKQTVKLTKTKLTMKAGASRTIRLKGAKASRVSWRSSKKSVASVSKGKIKAKKAGKAVITAKYKGRKYRCKVTVKKKAAKPEQQAENGQLTLMLGETKVNVKWNDNESVAALKKLVKEKPLVIDMSMYGGFEQVGSIGARLPRNDKETTTAAGDIVLYSGNQIVVFYGSNTWSYTRLGHITDQTAQGMRDLLGHGDIKLTLTLEDAK